MRFTHKIISLICVPLMFEIVLVGILVTKINDWQRRCEHEAVIEEQFRLIDFRAQALLQSTNYLALLGRDAKYSAPFHDSFNRLKKLKIEIVADEDVADKEVIAAQNKMFDEIVMIVEELRPELTFKVHTPPIFANDLLQLAKLEQLLIRYTKPRHELVHYCTMRIHAQRAAMRDLDRQINDFIRWGELLSITLTSGLVIYFNRGTGKRIDSIRRNILALSCGGRLSQPLGGRDEIGVIEATFRQMAAQLAHAEQMSRDATAIVTNDLKTPLSELSELLNRFQQGELCRLNARGRDKVKQSRIAINRLLALIGDLYDTEQFRGGGYALEVNEEKLDDLIERSIQAIADKADRKQQKIEHRLSNISAECELKSMVRVVVNLLDNAIKFSPKHSTILISVTDERENARVRVSDKGGGVVGENQETIFDCYMQAEPNKHQDFGGTGLGLAIAKAITESHNGSIGVYSEPNVGSTFWILLPKKQPVRTLSVTQ